MYTSAWVGVPNMPHPLCVPCKDQRTAARGDQKLAAFLASLEPLLIEMAYEAYRNSPETRGRMQQEVRDGLLFRVRAVSQQLQKSTLST